jgi:sensor histidine kinase YesM
VVIQFETICFNRPKAARFSWRINDNQQDWSPWQDENYAVLTNLQDGKSILQVRTMIPGLPDSETLSSIPIIVSIALWKQEWFFPTMLGMVSILVLLSLVLFFQTRTRLIQTNKQAKMFQLQAILSQLNPHFIFNVMASLQSMILSANIEKANDYLVRMSSLIRGFLDASASASFSRSKSITATELPLKKELEILDHFIQFQQLIYPDRFEYELSIGSEIIPEKLTIPPMLIQPFVENSIKHGLLQKGGKGKLKISIYFSEKQTLIVEIEDNGIGIEKAEALEKQSHLLYTSRGKELTLKRIKLLNDMGYFIQYRIDSTDSGTKVTLKIKRNAE